jgi:molybdopterin-guanine dinucleotide biosynthesis protein A
MSDVRASARYGGIVLCGGQGLRMGQPKATLPFGPESLVARVSRLLGEVVYPVVVVAAAGQDLPPLPLGVEVVHDRRGGRGPLEGLAPGLEALAGRVDAAFVTGCDAPLLKPDFIRHMLDLLGRHAIAVPEVAGRLHPLAAVYRMEVAPQIEHLLSEDRLRLTDLLDRVDTCVVRAEELAAVDPALDSLRNVNDPAEYRAALALAGFAAPN